MSVNNTLLFACSRCFSRHPFEELSSVQQLCKECRGAFPVVKCTYCRSEFQQTNKDSTSTICKKCEQNVKAYGKPTACEYCNIIAAFIGSKCQRCTNSEIKYGPAVTCDQCKQRCAFDRNDDNKKVDGKLLCWLCTLSYKRALAKTRLSESERRRAKLRVAKMSKEHSKPRGHNKRPNRVDVTKIAEPEAPPPKATRGNAGEVDPNSSDHVVAMTQLKETIASLNKKIIQKDALILAKEKQITELKANHFTIEQEFRNKMKDSERRFNDKCLMMDTKIQSLLKEVATLSKSAKRTKDLTCSGNSGSGTDSPSNN
uniref:Protein FAM76A n=1 Tax=Xenopsylla cheopis TaxID=163159 RepID=A0A6M2DSD4_XENCH